MFHAVITPTFGTKPLHHTVHRTLTAAARKLSPALRKTMARGIDCCGIVSDTGDAWSLSEAQGKGIFPVAPCVREKLVRFAGVAHEESERATV